MIATITTYQWLLLVHIVTAVAWVGGGVMLTILAALAVRSSLPGRKAEFAHEAAFVGERIFAPLSVLLIIFGAWAVHEGHWKYSTAWVTIGIVGWIVSFLIGIGFLAPQSKKIARAIDAEGPDSKTVSDLITRILLVARVDSAILVLIVADMVLKPGQ
jgi:uncharacterized membrane protein